MPRLLFEKTGRAVWISHLDLMRLFQRAFARAGLPLTHTQGYNPRPSVSIALPMPVGMESVCELLDFSLEGETPDLGEICARLNEKLIDGVQVRECYDGGQKLGNLTELACHVTLFYDSGVPQGAKDKIAALFARDSLPVLRRTKRGDTETDIRAGLRGMTVTETGQTVVLAARVCCREPSLSPLLLPAAVERYLPELAPDFTKCSRDELFDAAGNIFR